MALQHSNHMPRHYTVWPSHQSGSGYPNHSRYAVGYITISHGENIYRFYGHRFENNLQYQNTFSVSSTNQFHMEDDVIILDMPAIPSLNQIRLGSQNARNSRAPASDVISDKTIEANLNIKKHSSCTNASSEASSDHDMCVVCQSQYENSEQIGALQCGHQYHLNCIKKWLRKKNLCPICKATAISL